MKSFIYLLRGIMFLISKIYSLKLSEYFKRLGDRMYGFWMVYSIPNCSKNAKIYRDCTIKGVKYIHIGNNTVIDHHSVITAWDSYLESKFEPCIKIGSNVSIGEYCHLSAINSINIGDNVLTGRRLTIIDNYHGRSSADELKIPPLSRCLFSKGPVTIGNNVWIGDNVTILSGVAIGDNCIIGANSVVTKSFLPNSIIGGNPGHIIKTT